ncbi:hypothetical protein CMQ_3742 [Grosmannia clavigera kw1407]|uniref:RNA polymerase II subunit B1 CTD phosphatase RPAP2 homolog n=1 Tax=Grosmannia clavigera (strain kw1407 / UAMH 11150) TaxID=655863 RepID=F0X8K4_GROCL|nr:uncharacterized protein CMQ_3742 [Grosmannia clavigera kw1407]EFX05673.1 hypothetical protein CMQ_3742 [Grosmannia clavigera kw1407]
MASEAERPLKGILKTGASRADDASGTVATHSRRQRTEEDNAEIAGKHAAILQQRRDLEAAIFLDIDRLTAFPLVRTPSYSSARPAPSDAAAFRQLVRTFQPGDYDDLIEERNTCGLCGYALCANPRKTFAGRGSWKLAHGGIMPKGELERWCSAACARRALYIKVQLNETAAWERVGIPDIEVDLYEDDQDDSSTTLSGPDPEAQLAQDLARLKLHEERRLAQSQAALALERGDTSSLPSTDPEVAAAQARIQPTVASVDVNIIEKPITSAPVEPTLANSNTSDDAHMLLEGHKIRFATK